MTIAEMTREQIQAIRRDYAQKGQDGRYQWSVNEVAARHGIGVGTLTKVARRWGLSRYMTHGSAA